jgi:hypothetical protein
MQVLIEPLLPDDKLVWTLYEKWIFSRDVLMPSSIEPINGNK